MRLTLNHGQIIDAIKAVGPDRTILVEGEAGWGKTAMLYAMAKDPHFADYHVVNPIDCTQMSDGSIWVPDIDHELGVSRELPNVRFGVHKGNRKGLDGSRPVLICLDEIAKARQYIKDALAPILYEHRIGEDHMPAGSIVFGCTNLSEEGLGDSMQAHMRDRIIPVLLRKPTQEEWVENFAVPRGLHHAVIATTMDYKQPFESFLDYNSDGPKSGQNLPRENPHIFNPRATQDKWVTGRSLHACSDILYKGGGLDMETLNVLITGAIGRSYAALLMSMVRLGQSLPATGAVFSDPKGTAIPSNAGARVMLAFKLITSAENRQQAEAVSQYMCRMPGEAQLLFASNVSKNTKKMGIFSTCPTFTKELVKAMNILNA